MRARSLTKIQSPDEVLNRVQDELLEKLNPVLRELAAPPTWISVGEAGAPPFLNGWTNFLGGFSRVSFLKDAEGFVHLRGLAKGGTAPGTLFTLPIGYRPLAVGVFAVGSNQAFGEVRVDDGGAVNLQFGSNIYVALDGITFFAEQ